MVHFHNLNTNVIWMILLFSFYFRVIVIFWQMLDSIYETCAENITHGLWLYKRERETMLLNAHSHRIQAHTHIHIYKYIHTHTLARGSLGRKICKFFSLSFLFLLLILICHLPMCLFSDSFISIREKNVHLYEYIL